MVRKFSIIIALSIIVTSCSIKTKVVEVPVHSCPKPIIPERPKLPIMELKESDSDSKVILSCGKSVELLIAYAKRLEKELESYRLISKEKEDLTIRGKAQ